LVASVFNSGIKNKTTSHGLLTTVMCNCWKLTPEEHKGMEYERKLSLLGKM